MTDRKEIKDFETLMVECTSRNIPDFIKELQELHMKGWEKIELESDVGDYYYLRVTKMRPETESEYNKRIALENKMKESRRIAYENLKKEFG